MKLSTLSLFAYLAFTCLMPACSAQRSGPYNAANPDRRDTAAAERLTREAADLIGSDPAKAEKLLRDALTADLFHGPAHNNLGVLFLEAGQLYEAANEFEWARKLMPGHPDPRLNLGLVLERGGRIDEAIDTYRTALAVAPNHLPAIQALTRCQIRHDRQAEDMIPHLEYIGMNGTSEWRDWARRQVLRAVD